MDTWIPQRQNSGKEMAQQMDSCENAFRNQINGSVFLPTEPLLLEHIVWSPGLRKDTSLRLWGRSLHTWWSSCILGLPVRPPFLV